MDSLIEIAERVKLTDPLRAGLLTQCHFAGVCTVELTVKQSPLQIGILHGADDLLLDREGSATAMEAWLDSLHAIAAHEQSELSSSLWDMQNRLAWMGGTQIMRPEIADALWKAHEAVLDTLRVSAYHEAYEPQAV